MQFKVSQMAQKSFFWVRLLNFSKSIISRTTASFPLIFCIRLVIGTFKWKLNVQKKCFFLVIVDNALGQSDCSILQNWISQGTFSFDLIFCMKIQDGKLRAVRELNLLKKSFGVKMGQKSPKWPKFSVLL